MNTRSRVLVHERTEFLYHTSRFRIFWLQNNLYGYIMSSISNILAPNWLISFDEDPANPTNLLVKHLLREPYMGHLISLWTCVTMPHNYPHSILVFLFYFNLFLITWNLCRNLITKIEAAKHFRFKVHVSI